MSALFLLGIIYLATVGLGLQDSLLGSAWPAMYRPLDVPLHYAGIASMILALGPVAASIISARLIKRFGTGIVVGASLVITAAALTGISVSRSFLFLCLFAIPMGLGGGSIDVAVNNYVALHYKSRYMSWLHCFWGVGASLGPIIMSWFLLRTGSWSMGYRSIGAIQFCIAALLFILLPLWAVNRTDGKPERQSPHDIKKLFSTAGVKEALAAFFCYCAIELTTGIWGASYLVSQRGIPPETAAKWISFYYIGITVGRFISGFISIKLSDRQMIRLGQIVTGCGIVVMVLPFGNALVLPGLFMIGLGCAPVFPSMIHATARNFGKEHSPAIIAMQMGSSYTGTALMPPIFGLLTPHMSFGIFPFFIGAALIIKIAMVEILNRKVDNKIATTRLDK